MNEQPNSNTLKQPELVGANPAPESVEGNATSNVETPSVDLMSGLSDKEKSYMKGLGINEINAETLQKLVHSGLAQKDSVSKLSREKAEYEAMLASRGESTVNGLSNQSQSNSVQPEAMVLETPMGEASEELKQEPQRTTGVTKNDIWDLSLMINREFPELIDRATNGEIFNELTMRGYFGADGIDKKAVYEYLSRENATAKEFRELKEKVAEYEKANQSEPQYNPQATINNGVRDLNWANAVLRQNLTNPGSVDFNDLNEATIMIQSSLL